MKTFGLQPCREIGAIKTQIKDAILEGDISNDKQEAYQLMLKLGEQIGLKVVKG